jgi:hypothetical protein
VALAWRKSFSRIGAVTAIAEAIRESDLSCLRYLDPEPEPEPAAHESSPADR